MSPTAAPTAEPQVTATPTPTTAPSDPKEKAAQQVNDFVGRIYKYILGREPEAEGQEFWASELLGFNRSGAEVANGFLFSEEFLNRNTTDEEFVTILYNTFFGREPDEGGLAYWLDQLKTGTMDRATVASGFVYSKEWANTCAEYGIASGCDTQPDIEIEPTQLTFDFVSRIYERALGREAEKEGLDYWSRELANYRITGEQVGAMFFMSEELTNQNLNNGEFINRLYATFLDREADADGRAYWVSVLEQGTDRLSVVMGFTRSPEFTDKCVDARIKPY